MRPVRRCWIRRAAEPKPATSGRSRVMIGLGPDLTHPPGVVYACALGGAVHGLRLLEGYRGIIHCDGYEAYETTA